jgi:hypothetical protein
MKMSELIATGASEAVISLMESQGLTVRRNLKLDIPAFPNDITMVDDQELMILAAKYMENYNFVSTQVACAAIAELEAENAYEMSHARGLMLKTTGKTTEKSIMLKAAVLSDPDTIKLIQDKTHAYAYRKMLETMQDSLERYYYLVSRELTRRTHGEKMRFNKYTP